MYLIFSLLSIVYVHLICNKHHACKFFIIICREYNQPNLPKHAPCKHNNLHDSGLNSDVLPDLKFEKSPIYPQWKMLLVKCIISHLPDERKRFKDIILSSRFQHRKAYRISSFKRCPPKKAAFGKGKA